MKYAAIADWAERQEYRIKFMCEQLGVSVSGYYSWREREESNHAQYDTELTIIIRDIFEELNGNVGRRRMVAELATLGHFVSVKRVHRLMTHAGLQGRFPKPWRKTTIQGTDNIEFDDLIQRDFTAEQPNEKWCGDITYIKTVNGWVFLATVIDLYSRMVVGWAVADHMKTNLVIEALDMAVKQRRPLPGVIFHSDRGSQYTSSEFTAYCEKYSIRQSLGRTGICYDNAVAESFFATYKKELIHRRPWMNLKTVRKATFSWIEQYYNRRRRHSTLGYLTPSEYELGLRTLAQVYELAA